MPDMNDMLSAAAKSAVNKSGWEATSPVFGQSAQAVRTLTGGTLPDSEGVREAALAKRLAARRSGNIGAVMPQDQFVQGGSGLGEDPMGAVMPMADPLEIFKAQGRNAKEPLSLKTVKKAEKEKIMKAFKNCRGIADNQYKDVVEPEILHRRKVYEADAEYYDKIFPNLSQTSRWVSKDVKTSCSWIQTGLVEAFCSSEAPLSVKGVNIEDDEVASKVQELVRYQLEKKNDWYHFCMTEIGYALSENFCVAKVWWKREEKRTPMEFMLDLNDVEAIIGMTEASATGAIENIKVEDIKDSADFVKVSYDLVEVTKNHPVVEYVPTSEIRYTPDAPDLQDCKFVAHRKIVRGDYLKRRERDGVYEDVDKALEDYNLGNTAFNVLDIENDRDRTDRGKRPTDNDNASKEVELYEAYLQVDYNDDGIYENVIVHAVGDTPIRIVENDFDFPPFFVCSSFYNPNVVFNRESFTDTLAQQQDLKTALVRQIITNVAKNNSPRVFVNERNVDMDALMNSEEIIPVQGNPSESMATPPQLPLSSVTMELIQYAQTEIESQSGSTRYNQGLDSNSLNSTATGITAILGMAEKRNKMIARSIAEKFFIPIYKFIILLNQKYLEDEQMVRLTNKSIAIRREDLDIDYDLIVNVGQGASTKEAQIQYLMLVLNQIYPQLAQQGIANAKSWYNLVCKLLEALGLRDVSQYLLDPESKEAQQQAAAAQKAQAEAQAQALQNSLQLSIAKTSMPRLNIYLRDLPPDVQRQYLEDKLGIKTTEKAIAEHEVLQHE